MGYRGHPGLEIARLERRKEMVQNHEPQKRRKLEQKRVRPLYLSLFCVKKELNCCISLDPQNVKNLGHPQNKKSVPDVSSFANGQEFQRALVLGPQWL